MKLQCQAFCQSNDVEAILHLLFSELKFAQADLFNQPFTDTLKRLSVQPSPDVLIIELQSGLPTEQSLHQLADVCEPGTKVIAIGAEVELAEYKRLIALGIEDYIALPLEFDVILNAVKQSLGLNSSSKRNKQVTVTGLQGGVGTTLITAALAHRLANSGTHTLLADIDSELGDLSTYWPSLNPLPLSGEQVLQLQTLTRAQQNLESRLNYLPISLNSTTSIDALSDKLSDETSWTIWDTPRHHPQAHALWSNADICIWVLEPSIGVLRHWHAIHQKLNSNLLQHPQKHQRHIFVLNQTRKERSAQISITHMEQALQQSLITLPYAPQQTINAANLGQLDGLSRGKLGEALNHLTAKITARPLPHQSTSSFKKLLNKITQKNHTQSTSQFSEKVN